ncbi:hypothetical protein CR203_10555 [Salipaludibacillus neizhouensis]|uniref:DUF5643 domain-containing protein n=1 Tax=Salipaludibacillus neizhouensis TaxID=885475 RepID=A0A3A9KJ56_9BACI|nr:hypothetical protein [Salipaludibacillus neizhouensis]RKL67775.1 hypothetical protein CR203_10555 [Salipaludibacillus neizhouensis]
MRLYSFLILLLSIGMISSCSSEAIFPSQSTSNNDAVPIVPEVTEAPLHITFDSITYPDGKSSIEFIAEHIDGSEIFIDDYQFQWPKYVSDNEGIMYEIEKVDISKNSKHHKKELGIHKIAITILLAQTLTKESASLHIPFYVIPSLFEKGYPFQVTNEDITRTKVADTVIDNIKIDGQTVSFTINDNQKRHGNPGEVHIFSYVLDNQLTYPLFSNFDQNDKSLNVELKFAQSIDYPAKFLIKGSTLALPKWRLSFAVPITKNDDS